MSSELYFTFFYTSCAETSTKLMGGMISSFIIVCADMASICFTFNRSLNTLRSRQNVRRFADDTIKCIFLNENVRISIKISLKFVPKGPNNSNPALVQIMAWRRSGDKPLSEPMMVSLLTHICVTRPQWVKVDDRPYKWILDSRNMFCVLTSIISLSLISKTPTPIH